jgi:hypothetical protein
LDAANRCSRKILQHQVALDLGLSMPDTLYSNSPEEVLAFVERHDGHAVWNGGCTHGNDNRTHRNGGRSLWNCGRTRGNDDGSRGNGDGSRGSGRATELPCVSTGTVSTVTHRDDRLDRRATALDRIRNRTYGGQY